MKIKYVIFFSLVLIICKLFYFFFVFPNPDEAYYWFWGQYPDFSYHDHPALQALTQHISFKLFGKSLFSMRLPVLLCNIICGFILLKITRKLSFKNSLLIILVFFSTPLFFMFITFAWNDYLLITNCLISGYFLTNFLNEIWLNESGKTKDLLFGCLFFGLAIVTKYNAIFLGLGVISLLITTKKFYVIFKDYRFYIGLFIIIITTSPILIWNVLNDYGSFEFNVQQRTINPLINGNLLKGNYIGFIIGSIFALSPFICWGIIRVFQKSNISMHNINSYYIVYSKFAKHIFLVSSITFLSLSIFSNVLYYWNIVGFLFITPLAINYLLEKKLLNYSLIYSSILIIGIVIHFGIVPLTSVFGGKDEDSIYHYGWNKISTKINRYQKTEKLPIVTSSYRNASLLAFTRNDPKIFGYSERFDQFDYWTKNHKYTSKKGLILTDDRSPLNKKLSHLFETINILDTIQVNKFSYQIKTYYLYEGIFK